MRSVARVDATHERETSPEGRQSFLYEKDSWGNRTLVEVADHRADGTTKAYEPASCLQAFLAGDVRGRPK
jgi:hypothetical protein